MARCPGAVSNVVVTVERGRLCCIITCNSLLAIKTLPHAARAARDTTWCDVVRHGARRGAVAFTMLSYFLLSIKSKICACSQTFNFIGKLGEWTRNGSQHYLPIPLPPGNTTGCGIEEGRGQGGVAIFQFPLLNVQSESLMCSLVTTV